MANMAKDFFQSLYRKDDGIIPNCMVNNLNEKVIADMNNYLFKEFSDEDISDALFQIGPLKAPRPDGFPARFFQRNWGVVREEVIGRCALFSRMESCEIR